MNPVLVPLHAREEQRLDVLKLANIVDTPRDHRFDRLIYMAAEIFRVPMACIAFIDANRCWMKSSVGIPVAETDRNAAFCAYTILQSDMMIVEDAAEDLRFSSNIFVVEEPFIRFYAGMPLVASEGLQIGSFCIMDKYPRQMSDQQMTVLRQLAQVAEELLDQVC